MPSTSMREQNDSTGHVQRNMLVRRLDFVGEKDWVLHYVQWKES